MSSPENPLIIQSDHTVLAEVDSPLYGQAREPLCRFAELVKPLGDRVALVSGDDPQRILRLLRKLGHFPVYEKPVPRSNG